MRGQLKPAIIDLALDGVRPVQIAQRLGCSHFLARVTVANARNDGIPIPYFRENKPSPKAMPQPEPKPSPSALTDDEEARIVELAKRGVGLTAIAAQLRRPYAMVTEAMDRLGVSRRVDGCEGS